MSSGAPGASASPRTGAGGRGVSFVVPCPTKAGTTARAHGGAGSSSGGSVNALCQCPWGTWRVDSGGGQQVGQGGGQPGIGSSHVVVQGLAV
eukprot:gene7225-biopygen5862